MPDQNPFEAVYGKSAPVNQPDQPTASPDAKPGPYLTSLPQDQESKFQGWVKQNNVPFDPSPKADYDMRGYWKDNQGKMNETKVSDFDHMLHFPDTYKTPYHKTFSNESKYATPNAPHWDGDRLIAKGGQVVADETPGKPGVSNPQGASGNPFESVYGAQNSQQNPQNADNGHGSLYNATDAVLNGPTTPSIGGGADPLMTLGKGLAKEGLSTLAGAGSIYNRLTGSKQPFNQANLSGLTDAKGVGEGVGKFAGQMAEFAGTGGESLAAKMSSNGALSGLQSGGDPIATTFGTALPAVMSTPAAKYAGKAVSKLLGMTTGAGESAVARAFIHPDSSGLAQVMRGEKTVSDVVDNLQSSISNYSDQARQAYRGALDKVTNQSIPDWHMKAGQAIQDLNDKLSTELKKFGFDESKDALSDKHLTGAPSEQVNSLINKIRNWGTEARDYTASGLDTLKKQLSEQAFQTGSPIASRLADHLKTSLEDIVPGYKEMTSGYNDSQELLRSMKKEFNVTGKASDNEGTISRKIQTMLKQNTNFRELLMDKMPNGSQLLDQIAGLHLNDVMPKGLMKTLIGAESFGAIAHHPAALAAMPLHSPRLVGEGARALGKVAASSVPVGSIAQKAISSGVNGALSGSQ